MPRSMSRNQNHEDDDASSSSSGRKRIMTFDHGDVAPWSDLNDHVLFLVTMQLGVVDFFSFSRVCKSWRSLALSNRNAFMASKPPISICNIRVNKDDWCHLKDFVGTKFKTSVPHFTGRICVGSTCGYLILFGEKTRDFWLVNLITRHELHFPDYPLYVVYDLSIKCILVFSPSISGWVFVMRNKRISFHIAGKRRWNDISSRGTIPILDLQVFKGKIYTLHSDCSLGELRLYPNRKRKWTLLETNNSPNPNFFRPLFEPVFQPSLVSSGEKLYVIERDSLPKNLNVIDRNTLPVKLLQLNFGEMKWVSPEKTTGEYAFFISWFNYSAVIRPESWADPRTQYKRLDANKSRKDRFYCKAMWYFTHDCLNVNLLDE